MRVLIDESLNTRLRHYFSGHDARTVEYMGWKGISNGELLALAREEFDAFITRDREIPNQQMINESEIPIIVLYARSNGLRDLLPLIPEVLDTLPNIRRGQVIAIYYPPESE